MWLEYLLHGGAAGGSRTIALFGSPFLAAALAAAVALTAVRVAGWRAGMLAAALGVLVLGGGVTGDLITHGGHDRERHEILEKMMTEPSAAGAHRLMELDSAESRNVWHLVTATGQGLLIAGLVGAAFVLWRRDVAAVTDEKDLGMRLRRAA
jgi:hypothetical protein